MEQVREGPVDALQVNDDTDTQCGVVFHDGEAGALAGSIRRACDADGEQLAAWGNNGKAAYREYFSMEVFARNVLGALDGVAGA